MTKRRADSSVNMRERDPPQPREVNGQNGEDGAELDQDDEGLAEGVVVEAKETLDQKQVPGRRYRQELGESFEHAEDERLEEVKRHADSAA